MESDTKPGDLKVVDKTCDSVEMSWKSAVPENQILYRKRGEKDWKIVRNVFERRYNVILLEPDTDYEFRIRSVREERKGAPELSDVVEARTRPYYEEEWHGFRLGRTRHVDTFPAGSHYPALEVYNDTFYLIEALPEGLFLSKLTPQLGVLDQKLIVPRKPNYYVGIQDSCLHQGKLYVTWNEQGGNPANTVPNSQHLGVYDMATDNFRYLTAVQSTEKGTCTWEGGVESWRGKLWVLYLDVWPTGHGQETKVVLRVFDPARRDFTEEYIWEDCPTTYPYGPSLGVFNDQLIILYSDLEPIARGRQANYEPLYYVRFDGESFHSVTKVDDRLRNRYAKGVEYGGRFFMFYKSNANYPEEGYAYHDIALSTIDKRTGKIDTTTHVKDRKYNSSPDATIYDGKLLVIYNKIEHSYGRPHDPALSMGCFLGDIERIK